MLSRLVIVMLLILMSATQVFAGNITFIKEYSYNASDMDSKLSSRTIALEQVKRLLLEELGTYLISETEVKNYQVTRDQITTLTAGIVAATIIDEKWDGSTYYLQAKLTADTSEVAKSLNALRQDKAQSKDLEEAKKKANQALKEVENLKKAMLSSKSSYGQKEAYTNAISELDANALFEKGFTFLRANNYKDAIATFNEAIKLTPKNADAYINRGLCYNNLGNFEVAIKDYNAAISLQPQNTRAYSLRGYSYRNNGDTEQAIRDYRKAIEIDPSYADAYYYLGDLYLGFYNYNPNAQEATNYKNEGIRHFQIAAKLGNSKAREFLTNKEVVLPTHESNQSWLTVVDNKSKTIWIKESKIREKHMTWQEANDLIGNLNKSKYAGRADWRLPNTQELRSIIGFNADVNQDYYWASCPDFDHGFETCTYTYIVKPNKKNTHDSTSSTVVDEKDIETIKAYVWPVCTAK